MTKAILNRPLVPLLLVIVLGFGLRLHYLNRPMRFDEALTAVAYVTKDIPSIVADYSLPNNHIFHTVLTHIVTAIAGLHPMMLRLPAFMSGVLMIPLTYAVCIRYYSSRQAALLAAGLVAVAPPLIDFSVNARGYMTQAAIVLVLLYLAHILKRRDHTGYWLLFGLLSAFGFFTIPVMLFAMAGISLWLLLSIMMENQKENRNLLLKNFTVAHLLGGVLTVILYTPVGMFSGWERLLDNPTVQALAPDVFYPQLPTILVEMLQYLSWEFPLAIVIIGVGGIIIGLGFHRYLSSDRLPLLLPLFAAALVILVLKRSIPFSRTWLYLIAPCIITASAGLTWIVRQRTSRTIKMPIQWQESVLVLLLCGVLGIYILQTNSIYLSNETHRADDAQLAAQYLAETMQAQDSFVASWPSNYTVLYYALLNNLNLQGSIDTGDVTAADLSTSEGYVYVYYHTEDELRRIAEAMGEVVYDAEIVHTLPASVIIRYPIDNSTSLNADE